MMDLFSLQGKRALVTGASRGLGRAMAESLAAAGADVVCSSSRKSGTDETAAAVKALGREVWQIAADLSSTEGAHRLVDEVTEAVGHIDILVNNAGTIKRHPAVELPMSEWEVVLRTNLDSVFVLSHGFLRLLVEERVRRFIMLASM